MYSDVKSVRILIAALKSYGVVDAVLSSGTCSIPVLHSLETDKSFHCYSDIDERSAVYFAIGISQAKKAPVAVVCTSGTAACNYLPGVCEAQKLKAPLIIITCDKDPDSLGNLTIQKINQEKIFGPNCNCSVNLPVIKDKYDEWTVKRMIITALLEAQHRGNGPVHINIYTDGDKKTFNMPDLPVVKKVERITPLIFVDNITRYAEEISQYEKVLVIIGENTFFDEETSNYLDEFALKNNVVVSAESVANTCCSSAKNTYRLIEHTLMADYLKMYKPDLVISLGGNYTSYEIKSLLILSSFEHWWIDPAGAVCDAWRKISRIFECSPLFFFKKLCEVHRSNNKRSQYSTSWMNGLSNIEIPVNKEEFTSLYVANELSKNLDNCSLLHLGILNSTRLMQYFDIPKEVRVYSNLGALGIDGSLSSFLGQASVNDKGISLCLIGDLSFIYDINSLCINGFPNNIKIVLLNNGGGSEFHLNTGIKAIPMIDDYISAGHNHKVREWIKSLGFAYFTARNVEDFQSEFKSFLTCDTAAFFEAITDIELDSLAVKKVQTSNGFSTEKKIVGKRLRNVMKKIIGVRKTQKLIQIAKIWREY